MGAVRYVAAAYFGGIYGLAKAGTDFAQADGKQDAYKAQERVARYNRANALRQGSAAEDTQRRQSALKLGQQRAAAAQSGFDSSSGSMATLQSQSAGELELDALTTRYESVLKSIGYKNEADRAHASAINAETSGYMNFASSMIGGMAGGGGYGG